jgi:hypothetical protein
VPETAVAVEPGKAIATETSAIKTTATEATRVPAEMGTAAHAATHVSTTAAMSATAVGSCEGGAAEDEGRSYQDCLEHLIFPSLIPSTLCR